jgi:hypothetical protein
MRAFYASLALFYLCFLWWYGGNGEPVTPAELETYIEKMQTNAKARGKEAEDAAGYMRKLAASDEGREYLMVNLIRFRERASYPPGSPWENDPDAMAADARYSTGIVPLLLKHGSLPVLKAPVTGSFINQGNLTSWDVVAIVRYRSVRDMLQMMVEMSAMDLVVHKWASIEQTQVFPTQPVISLFSVRLLVAAGLLVIALLVRLLVRVSRRAP